MPGMGLSGSEGGGAVIRSPYPYAPDRQPARQGHLRMPFVAPTADEFRSPLLITVIA